MSMPSNFNSFHSDLWTVNFSNMPSLSGMQDMSFYDNYVKSLVIHDYNMGEIFSDFQDFRIRHPMAPKVNADLSQIQIEFKINADFSNYLGIFEYMKSLKYGELSPNRTSDLIRKYTIKSINLNLMDNQKRIIAVMKFTEAFIISLSSLSLTTGTSDEVSFVINCSYQELLYEKKSVFV